MAQTKTNAMRILDAKKIDYQISTYENKDGKIDGVSVAEKINKDPRQVFKTLVAQGTSKEVYVFIIPVAEELDLKKAAKAAGEKKVDLVPVKDIQKLTGYIRGGCSPIGMKKHYKTFLEATASEWETIVVSAGKIGVQMELAVDDLLTVTEGTLADLKK
ncbi:Cys-tRNA(Pro) deacylase [Bacillus methanolicus]|uniref:Cys-tRNA(Pro)/Cys-tRNA(Cys) deacylase n=1 Tax=Bacillus methanolicus (strain MGA3 / ATCC 53907) TaxID=796606 RepID=I3EBS5_BACMM|nr:Cys-tRNA(Pro) deacylase [Bacillus methanolicus]AIE61626.1 ybaK/ebsC protein [Bacillus methanolicus MGA3]EIJ83946.1 ybaK/ebsC protein [Bacillus methanolicus MGA3]